MLFVTALLICISLSFVNSQTTFPCNASAPCGCSSTPAVTSRILGGETAVNNSWSWSVTILMNNTYFCAGVLISQSWVLTTPSCIWNFRAADLFVSAASHVFFSWRQWRSVSLIVRHPNFNLNNWVYDAMLLQLSSPFNMTDSSIARICMPLDTTTDYPPVNSSMVAVGWGISFTGGGLSQLLQQVTLQRVAYNTFGCNTSMIANETVQMCAAGVTSAKGTCQGDAGGPAMMYAPSQQWVLVGTISYSGGCSNTGLPSILTRTAAIMSWIRSMNINDLVTVSNVSSADSVTTSTTTTISTSTSATTVTTTSVTVTTATTSTSTSATTATTTSVTLTTATTATTTTRTTSTSTTTTSATTTTTTSTTSTTTTTRTTTSVTTTSSTSTSTTTQTTTTTVTTTTTTITSTTATTTRASNTAPAQSSCNVAQILITSIMTMLWYKGCLMATD